MLRSIKGDWVRLGDTEVYARISSCGYADDDPCAEVQGVFAIRRNKHAEPIGPKDADYVRLRGRYLLMADIHAGVTELFDFHSDKLVWRSTNARDVVFWPRAGEVQAPRGALVTYPHEADQ